MGLKQLGISVGYNVLLFFENQVSGVAAVPLVVSFILNPAGVAAAARTTTTILMK